MALGGLFGIFLASPSSAMAAGLVWGFLSVGFFSVTPGGDGLLSTISPVTIGYNIGSLMHNAWPGAGLISTISAGEESYRTTGLALILLLAYPVIFTGLIYAMFNRKELKE
jgi:ABC-type transport system involved in multi-copper enzyme maturation permease subunit